MKIRVANKDDFADQWNHKKIGAIYFEQSITGTICTQPFYFTEETDINKFRELYTHNQIYVPLGLFDEIEVIEEKEQTIIQ
ncbi:hypothetical protein KHA90_11820 [Flavobacterium psychroterrae]|uniref:Uncharacterized protein n=1 Tax=Flavobacterium psychroterrae TaxID=2133767 RepID=A0ABS5PBQ4_9FLAO|nr:hypothetical protein [Flavobacterium psychroterrae]MBS7231714.1 hypothetical protein [Flavobacterium psychroterrae]